MLRCTYPPRVCGENFTILGVLLMGFPSEQMTYGMHSELDGFGGGHRVAFRHADLSPKHGSGHTLVMDGAPGRSQA